jgi:hypothetical protein
VNLNTQGGWSQRALRRNILIVLFRPHSSKGQTMDSTLHSIIAAQYAQDRIAQATAARQVKQARQQAQSSRARRRALPRLRRRLAADAVALRPLKAH